ncbi:methyltransferase domain-containing protein [Maribacter sp. 2308TA10-17]|uniref:methyltransferase domain-containing protein n=1 Tax=Maribacter sp. 2308TA10-17 TaxID=3386276 RepID=UPI0039BCBCB7
MLIDLSERSNQPELMDDFREGLKSLRIVFDDINRVNSILGGSNITVNAVADLIKAHPQESYTIVDMGCGDGNMLREVAKYCKKRDINVRLIGIDLNTEALQLAEEASANYPEIEYQHRNILELKVTDLNCDIVINTLTMHHFTNKDLLIFLEKFNQLASIGVVINDLHRSRWAYYLFKAFSLIFIKTKTAKIDGLISISKGFIKSDLIQYSKSLPQIKHNIKWKWAFRYVWIMQPNRLT